MLFVAAGIRRSASTLTYQIACALTGNKSRHIRRWNDEPLRVPHVCESPVWWVAKTHGYIPELFQCVQNETAKVLVTIRDPRDIFVSVMSLKKMSFDDVIEWGVIPRDINQQRLWTENHSECIVLRYEDFVDDISLLAWVIAGMMKKRVNQEAIDTLVTTYSFENNKKRSDEQGVVAEDLLFPGHLQTGKVGLWKEVLTNKQVKTIKDIIGDSWFQKWGYGNI